MRHAFVFLLSPALGRAGAAKGTKCGRRNTRPSSDLTIAKRFRDIGYRSRQARGPEMAPYPRPHRPRTAELFIAGAVTCAAMALVSAVAMMQAGTWTLWQIAVGAIAAGALATVAIGLFLFAWDLAARTISRIARRARLSNEERYAFDINGNSDSARIARIAMRERLELVAERFADREALYRDPNTGRLWLTRYVEPEGLPAGTNYYGPLPAEREVDILAQFGVTPKTDPTRHCHKP